MEFIPASVINHRRRYLPLVDKLQVLFQEMDRAYTVVAAQYGFVCNGCRENCCLTRFHHHTLLEYLFLLEGIRGLAPDERHVIRQLSIDANQHGRDADRQGRQYRVMCPLNQNGRCRMYSFRPMICRLHGIPHELHPPGGRIVRNPGCDAFFDQCRTRGKTDYIPFDRTPFYRRMALLERELRQIAGFEGKIKLTIAQMMETMTDPVYEIDRR
jgi:Fe-S-cluster containining protein